MIVGIEEEADREAVVADVILEERNREVGPFREAAAEVVWTVTFESSAAVFHHFLAFSSLRAIVKCDACQYRRRFWKHHKCRYPHPDNSYYQTAY